MLSLCSGDGFYEYIFYQHRASEIVCYDYDNDAFQHAIKHHSSQKIKYNYENILNVDFGTSEYDIISMRGAIEHFSKGQQKDILNKISVSLKNGGYFCGDTVLARDSGEKSLEHHEFEWDDSKIANVMFKEYFSDIFVKEYKSIQRTTILWQCKK